MHFFELHYQSIIKYDFYNKFFLKSVKDIPKLRKIILNFSLKDEPNLIRSLSFLSVLELISFQKGKLTSSNVSNITFKIQKGNPVGCKVVLRKYLMYSFLSKLVLQISPNLNQFEGIRFSLLAKNSLSFKIKKILLFPELLNQYELFKNISFLHITLVGSMKNINKLFYLLRSFRLPLNKVTS